MQNRPVANNTWDNAWLVESLESTGWSQAEMARRMGVSDATLSRWMRGQRAPRWAKRLAWVFVAMHGPLPW